MVQVNLGKALRSDVVEKMRVDLVRAMRDGMFLILNVDQLSPDFTRDYSGPDNIFPTAKVFDKEEWKKMENYTKVVQKKEMHSIGG